MSALVFPHPQRQLHPKTWLILGISALILALLPFSLALRLGLLALQMFLLLWAGVGARYLFFALSGLLPVAAMAWLIQAFSHGGGLVYSAWEPTSWLSFALTGEGIHAGYLLAVQVFNFGTACALMSLPTTASGIRYALTSWHLPNRLIYLIVATLNAPTQLSRYAAIVQEAALARGISEHRFLPKIWLKLRTLSTLFTLILIEHEDRGRTLAQRGIEKKGSRTFLQTYPDSFLQGMIRLVAPIISLESIVLTLWGAL